MQPLHRAAQRPGRPRRWRWTSDGLIAAPLGGVLSRRLIIVILGMLVATGAAASILVRHSQQGDMVDARPGVRDAQRATFPGPRAAEDGELTRRIAERIDSLLGERHPAFSITVLDQSGRPLYELNATVVRPTASLYKLGVMYEVYRRASAGTLDLSQTMTLTDDDFQDDEPGSGLGPGQTVTIGQLVRKMIVVSSNGAARALLRIVGHRSVEADFQALGMVNTHLAASGASPLVDAAGNAMSGTTSADMARFFSALTRPGAIPSAMQQGMLRVLAEQQINDRIPAYLPRTVKVLHKTGDLAGVRNDAGIVLTPERFYVVAALSAGPDISPGDDTIARLSQQIFAALAPSPG